MANNEKTPPRCGWCCWKPDFLQRFYKWPFGLGTMCWFMFLQAYVYHGIMPVCTTALERRFKLSSTQIGWFNSVLELTAAGTTIFLSYMSDRTQHRPRWLMLSAFFFALGCLVIALPHFIAEPYDGQSPEENLCGTSQFALNVTLSECRILTDTTDWYAVLMVGSAILGIGVGMILTIGIPFIDDFSDSAAGPFRISIIFLSGAIGAAVGFASGSAMLRLDVNFNRKDWPQFEGNIDFNPKFVGAWWLGFIIGMVGFCTVIFLFSCFDYEMPETQLVKPLKKTETHQSKLVVNRDLSGKPRFVRVFTQLRQSLVRILTNPVLVLVTISFVTHGLMSDGLQPFLVKIFRTQYEIRQEKAGLAIAVLIVVSIGLGNLCSGCFLKRGDFGLRTMILIVLTAVTIATAFGFGFLLHCPQQRISGITVDYEGFGYYDDIPDYDPARLDTTCNSHCDCTPDLYDPICSPKLGIQFFSPCHAGCRVFTTKIINSRNVSVYADCLCILPLFFQQMKLPEVQQKRFEGLLRIPPEKRPAGAVSSPQVKQLVSAYRNFSKTYGMATGVCDIPCDDFYGAMVIFFFILFLGYFTLVPLATIVMRCVPEEDRSFALAFHHSMERFLGAIPGPIMMGAIIDRVCLFREKEVCDENEEGACNAYDSPQLAWWIVGVFGSLHVIAITCYILAFILYKPPSGQSLRDYVTCRKKEDNDKGGDGKMRMSEKENHDNPAYADGDETAETSAQ